MSELQGCVLLSIFAEAGECCLNLIIIEVVDEGGIAKLAGGDG